MLAHANERESFKLVTAKMKVVRKKTKKTAMVMTKIVKTRHRTAAVVMKIVMHKM